MCTSAARSILLCLAWQATCRPSTPDCARENARPSVICALLGTRIGQAKTGALCRQQHDRWRCTDLCIRSSLQGDYLPLSHRSTFIRPRPSHTPARGVRVFFWSVASTLRARIRPAPPHARSTGRPLRDRPVPRSPPRAAARAAGWLTRAARGGGGTRTYTHAVRPSRLCRRWRVCVPTTEIISAATAAIHASGPRSFISCVTRLQRGGMGRTGLERRRSVQPCARATEVPRARRHADRSTVVPDYI
jgi:hypothetical protein